MLIYIIILKEQGHFWIISRERGPSPFLGEKPYLKLSKLVYYLTYKVYKGSMHPSMRGPRFFQNIFN